MILSGFVPPEARDRRPALEYVRFDVPADVLGLHVEYRYDEGHTIDLGLVDPTIEAFPSCNGFRGWSGGARRSVYVGTQSATPGYLTGEIVSGAWHVVLGLASLGPNGCAYEIEIEEIGSTRSSIEFLDPSIDGDYQLEFEEAEVDADRVESDQYDATLRVVLPDEDRTIYETDIQIEVAE